MSATVIFGGHVCGEGVNTQHASHINAVTILFLQCSDALVGRQEWHPTCKKTVWWGDGTVIIIIIIIIYLDQATWPIHRHTHIHII